MAEIVKRRLDGDWIRFKDGKWTFAKNSAHLPDPPDFDIWPGVFTYVPSAQPPQSMWDQYGVKDPSPSAVDPETCVKCKVAVTCGLDMEGLCCNCSPEDEMCDKRKMLQTQYQYWNFRTAASPGASLPTVQANRGGVVFGSARLASEPDPPPPPLKERIPLVSTGMFWRVKPLDKYGLYDVELRKRIPLTPWSRKVAEGAIPLNEMSDDAVVKECNDILVWVRAREKDPAPQVGEYRVDS